MEFTSIDMDIKNSVTFTEVTTDCGLLVAGKPVIKPVNFSTSYWLLELNLTCSTKMILAAPVMRTCGPPREERFGSR